MLGILISILYFKKQIQRLLKMNLFKLHCNYVVNQDLLLDLSNSKENPNSLDVSGGGIKTYTLRGKRHKWYENMEN